MRILETFCGNGGWTIPFWYDGDSCTGIDIVKTGYPAKFIQADMRLLKGEDFRGFDVIFGSVPCNHFSDAQVRNNAARRRGRDTKSGLELIEVFKQFVAKAKPRFYLMENVESLTKWYREPPQSRFKMSKGGKRLVWSNIPLPEIIPFNPQHKIREIHGWDKTRWWRSFIPYPIARFVADRVKGAIV